MKVKSPFLVVNPKSYLYGQKSLELAKAADETAAAVGIPVLFTCPYADIRLIRENTACYRMRAVYGSADAGTRDGTHPS